MFDSISADFDSIFHYTGWARECQISSWCMISISRMHIAITKYDPEVILSISYQGKTTPIKYILNHIGCTSLWTICDMLNGSLGTAMGLYKVDTDPSLTF